MRNVACKLYAWSKINTEKTNIKNPDGPYKSISDILVTFYSCILPLCPFSPYQGVDRAGPVRPH